MMGRYGSDKLNIALLVASVILSLFSRFLRLSILTYISYIPLFWGIFRMFSRDINKRIQENQKFLKYYNKAENWTKNKFNMIKGLKTYKYFTCPNCKQTVRVPRGKGRVNVICPKCSTKFIKST
jgi:predicted RNA-binding Zn-ribbon protein involved in translation (DUF1610 family)